MMKNLILGMWQPLMMIYPFRRILIPRLCAFFVFVGLDKGNYLSYENFFLKGQL